MNLDWPLIKSGLWKNTLDAIKHGADHFRAYADSQKRSKHDLKWAILSSHQAAECFSNILLIEITPEEPKLIKNSKLWFPSLAESVKMLLDGRSGNVLSNAELRLITLYKNLPEIRNQLTHRTLPTALEASDAAIALLGTLKVARIRMGPCLEEYQFDTPPIESEIHQAIPYKKNDAYIEMAFALLQDYVDVNKLGYCGLCGKNAIESNTCQLCYTEFEDFTCPKCGEVNYYEQREAHNEMECCCGNKYRT